MTANLLVVFDPRAEDDIDAAAQWYAQQASELAPEFLLPCLHYTEIKEDFSKMPNQEEGLVAFEAGNYTKAFELLKPIAERQQTASNSAPISLGCPLQRSVGLLTNLRENRS